MQIPVSQWPVVGAVAVALSLLPSPLSAHNLDKKTFGQLKASTKNFAHAEFGACGDQCASPRVRRAHD